MSIAMDFPHGNHPNKHLYQVQHEKAKEALDLLLILESFPILVIYFLRYYLFVVSFSFAAGCLTYILFQFRVDPQSFEHPELKKVVSLSLSHNFAFSSSDRLTLSFTLSVRILRFFFFLILKFGILAFQWVG